MTMVKEKHDVDVLEKCPTGIRGLDEITKGGLPRGRPTLICGVGGSSKRDKTKVDYSGSEWVCLELPALHSLTIDQASPGGLEIIKTLILPSQETLEMLKLKILSNQCLFWGPTRVLTQISKE
jgi:hypothetical protein